MVKSYETSGAVDATLNYFLSLFDVLATSIAFNCMSILFIPGLKIFVDFLSLNLNVAPVKP